MIRASALVAVLLSTYPALPLEIRDESSFQAVTGVPGAFELRGAPGTVAKGEPLVGGLGVFSMEYAHRMGRREPLRPMDADLSDWKKAPECPPDRVLIDRKTGRLRFFAGHDPAAFKTEVTARYREMNGDNAYGAWHGNNFLLSHWSCFPNLWAYDLTDPQAPRRVGETSVPRHTYGFLVLERGLALRGTDRGVHCVDASNPSRLVVKDLSLSSAHWFGPITSRYVAGWKSSGPTSQFQ